ncbi:head fiber protein [Bacillus phage vB_Bpu_PumA2]|uniref:Head fiber protein n=1 Tax=Bacillus phage vB_Bpu_PumA2 TaxID=2662128 RepID=A0A5Q2WCU4_9CAUD|nr:head fiber protein [Bacillus phage vB_Bpu_PumA2]QGH74235.1 head fiber protein [Bacillus phage vB_Bpu_PumA2]
MVMFQGVAGENIPAGSLVRHMSQDGKLTVTLARGEKPDYFTTRQLTEGKDITINLLQLPYWRVKTNEDLEAGSPVKTDSEGFLIKGTSSDNMGYVLNTSKKGSYNNYVIGQAVQPTTINDVEGLEGTGYELATSDTPDEALSALGATSVGTNVLQASSAANARTAIGAGTPYTLPKATIDTLGGMKKAGYVNAMPANADLTMCVDRVNQILAALKSSAIM